MKKLFGFSLLLTALTTFASGENYQTCMGEYDQKFVTIPGLEAGLFQEFKIQNSRGPRWGSHIEYNIDDVDLHEQASYWNEDGYPDYACEHFTLDDFEYANEAQYDFGVDWQSVKRLEGSQKTVFYLATPYITIYGRGGKECSLGVSEYDFVFLNELDEDGDPIYLGRLTDDPTCR
ncbi:MAG: hypothetical protein OXB88_03045 [Bacteriovoracales bacterium]|nr:hypothetical protein [Bacteriovoracales bacterium]